MATRLKNLSKVDQYPSGKGFKIGIVVSEWNTGITKALCDGAISTLKKCGVKERNIIVKSVPGSFELPLAAQFMAEYTDVDGVICLGCVIQGETRHFDFICQGVTNGIMKLNLKFDIPVVFGVLTTNTLEQAQDRAGGKHGNKGDEAAITAVKMISLKQDFEI